jgi:hypothetical protein
MLLPEEKTHCRRINFSHLGGNQGFLLFGNLLHLVGFFDMCGQRGLHRIA